MQSIWTLISETYVAPRQLVGIFPTQAAAEEYRDTAVAPVIDGFIEEWGLEGVYAETYIDLAATRLQKFQTGEFSCPENEKAIMYLGLALNELNARTAEREARGVEGSHTV